MTKTKIKNFYSIMIFCVAGLFLLLGFLVNKTNAISTTQLIYGAVGTDEHWIRTYGTEGEIEVHFRDMAITNDGGAVITGIIEGNIWLFKIDANGIIEWQKKYIAGQGTSVQVVKSGGYILLGRGNNQIIGGEDILLFRLNQDGDILWQKGFGEFEDEIAYTLLEMSDGGFYVWGQTMSFGNGDWTPLLLKIDASGGLEFQRIFSSSAVSQAYLLIPTIDGGLLAVGDTDLTGSDPFAIRLDSNGNFLWQQVYSGNSGQNEFWRGQETSDLGFILAGYAREGAAGEIDAMVMKLNSSGLIEWEKTFGSFDNDFSFDVTETQNGDFLVVGYMRPYPWSAGDELWILKLNSSGAIVWDKTYSIGERAIGFRIDELPSGDILVGGETLPIIGGANYDALLMRLDQSGNVKGCSAISTGASTPANLQTTIIPGEFISQTVSIWATSPAATPIVSIVEAKTVCIYPLPTLTPTPSVTPTPTDFYLHLPLIKK